MPKLSTKSQTKLNTCHSDLIKLIEAVAETEKCAVSARWGQSKHNHKPSLAVDVVPLPLDWEDIPAFEKLGEKIMAKAEELGIKIKWGRDFTGLKDYPHWELV